MKVIYKYVQMFIDNIVHSFNGSKKGSSAKKLSAFAIMNCIIALHVFYFMNFDMNYFIEILITDFAFVSALFGIGTYEKKIEKTPENKEINS